MTTDVQAAPLRCLKIEESLAGFFGRKYCQLTLRGTTALTAALHALRLPPGTGVLFPAAMCSIPVFSAVFAGLKPVFSDVSLDDGNFSLEDVERCLKRHRGKIGAMVPIHMFGRPERLDELRTLAGRYDVSVIEDAALSMGARYKNKRVGGFGQISCLSFVRKMIPLEMGGAVLTDDPLLYRHAKDFVDRLPPVPVQTRERSLSAMKSFHTLTGRIAQSGWKNVETLRPFEQTFRHLFLARTEEDDWRDSIVLDELEELENAVAVRRVRAETLDTALTHPRLKPLLRTDSCHFAYPIRLQGLSAEAFLEFAGQRGRWFKRIAYPDVSRVFSWLNKDARPDFPNALLLEKEVIGFPVDGGQPVSLFWKYAENFLQLFHDFVKREPFYREYAWRGKLERRMR